MVFISRRLGSSADVAIANISSYVFMHVKLVVRTSEDLIRLSTSRVTSSRVVVRLMDTG